MPTLLLLLVHVRAHMHIYTSVSSTYNSWKSVGIWKTCFENELFMLRFDDMLDAHACVHTNMFTSFEQHCQFEHAHAHAHARAHISQVWNQAMSSTNMAHVTINIGESRVSRQFFFTAFLFVCFTSCPCSLQAIPFPGASPRRSWQSKVECATVGRGCCASSRPLWPVFMNKNDSLLFRISTRRRRIQDMLCEKRSMQRSGLEIRW